MPLYEYICNGCGLRFERIRKFSDPPLNECPTCGATVEKQISSPAIQFKGSGFYITDYAKAGKGEGASSGSASGKSTDGKDPSSKSESSDKTEKSEKAEKSEKSDKGEKPARSDASDSSSSSSSRDSAPSAPAPSSKPDSK